MVRFPMRALRQMKQEGRPIAMISLYDAPTASLCCEAGADVLLVGDSLGNVLLGHDDTLSVTMDDMVRHTAAVARGVRASSRPTVPIVADMPFASYHGSPGEVARNGAALVRAGASAVKVEGAGPGALAAVRLLAEMGAPGVGHIGFTPQSALGFERVVQGRQDASAQLLREQALALEESGASLLVLEAVAREAAADITAALSIPTIGIGAGAGCSGQVLVWNDLAGLTPAPPRFVRRFADAATALRQAARDYVEAVHNGEFPTDEHSWSTSI
jgi:3-methyl-2-oxobutanoate hydroxymethyltransferase